MAERDAPSISPIVRYRDAAAGIDFLTRAFGFSVVQDHRDDAGLVVHAELEYDGAVVMLGSEREGPGNVFGPRAGTGWSYVVVEDPDAHHARARDAGAEIIRPLEDQDYGSRDYAARDPEENVWSFGTYRPVLPG